MSDYASHFLNQTLDGTMVIGVRFMSSSSSAHSGSFTFQSSKFSSSSISNRHSSSGVK